MNKQIIKSKVELNLPLTAKERATYLLFIATDKEVAEFLAREK